jgi:hypothetical protein
MGQSHGAAENLFVDFAGDRLTVFNAISETSGQDLRLGACGVELHLRGNGLERGDAGKDWRHVNPSPSSGARGPRQPSVPGDNRQPLRAGLNWTYQGFGGHHGIAILPPRTQKSRDNAKVADVVLMAEYWTLARLRNRRFLSLTELNAATGEWSSTLVLVSCASSAKAAASCSPRSTGRR